MVLVFAVSLKGKVGGGGRAVGGEVVFLEGKLEAPPIHLGVLRVCRPRRAVSERGANERASRGEFRVQALGNPRVPNILKNPSYFHGHPRVSRQDVHVDGLTAAIQ